MLGEENASLSHLLQPYLQPQFHLQSRIHKLNTFGENVFAKRDDELSSGITGSKLRKFASLLPFLCNEKYDEVLLIDSAQSNNITGLLQLCNEENICTKLMLLESNESDYKGNLLWINLLYQSENTIWVRRADWKNVNRLAENYKLEAEKTGKKIFIVYEGAANVEALPGAMTLANDILYYEKLNNTFFGHIFIDSGSGITAAGLLHGLALANSRERNIHITLVAGNEVQFHALYTRLVKEASSIYGWPEKYFGQILFCRPAISSSFGSITRQVLDEVKYLAKHEGILAEPVYTAKHFYTARKIIAGQKIAGNSLIINSGGSLGLSGFQEKLSWIL